MDSATLKYVRESQGKDRKHMADIIGKEPDTYSKKERGEVKFSPEEICAITVDLNLSLYLFNVIFFDSNLPFGNIDNGNLPTCNNCSIKGDV